VGVQAQALQLPLCGVKSITLTHLPERATTIQRSPFALWHGDDQTDRGPLAGGIHACAASYPPAVRKAVNPRPAVRYFPARRQLLRRLTGAGRIRAAAGRRRVGRWRCGCSNHRARHFR
jgi:hypothetical protein